MSLFSSTLYTKLAKQTKPGLPFAFMMFEGMRLLWQLAIFADEILSNHGEIEKMTTLCVFVP